MSGNFRDALRHGEDCPATEVMLEAMEHGAGANQAIAAHVKQCPSCQTELALFRSFESGEVEAGERAAVDYIVRGLRNPQSEPWWRRLLALGTPVRLGGFAVAAAALLLTFGLSTQWQSRRSFPPPGPETGALRSSAIVGISPQGEVAAFPSIIRWEPVPGASGYTVSLSEVDRNVIFHKNVTSPELEVPKSMLELMVPGRTVLLTIAATDASGSQIAQSGQIRVAVRAAPVSH